MDLPRFMHLRASTVALRATMVALQIYSVMLLREDCLKRGMRKAEEEERLSENANNSEQWKSLTKVAMQRSDY